MLGTIHMAKTLYNVQSEDESLKENYNVQSEDESLKENTIDWDRINVKELLTSGNFGYVYKGMNRNKDCS